MEINNPLHPDPNTGQKIQDDDPNNKQTQSPGQDNNGASKTNDVDNAHSFMANDSVSSNSQDPYMEFPTGLKNPSLFYSGSSILKSDLMRKIHGFTPNPTKFSPSIMVQKADQIEGDSHNQASPEDVHVISNVSFPISLLSRDNSVEFRQKPILGEGAPRHLNETDSLRVKPVELSQSNSMISEITPTKDIKEKKKKEGFLTRALNSTINKIKTSKSILKNKDSAPKARKRFVTYLSPEIKKTPSDITHQLESVNASNTKNDPEDIVDEKEGIKELDEEKNSNDIPIEKLSEDVNVPVRYTSHERVGTNLLKGRPSREIVKQNSGHSQSDVNISPSLLQIPNHVKRQSYANKTPSSIRSSSDRRRVSLGHNLQQVQAEAVKQAMKFPKAKKFAKKTLSLFLLIILTFILLSIFNCLITYPYDEIETHVWAGQFFHGFLLAGIPLVFLKETIKAALNDAAKQEKIPSLINKRYGLIDMIVLAILLMPISGVIMVQLMKNAFDLMSNSIEFFGAESIVLLFNITAISGYFITKNHFNKKKAKKTKRQGFFFIPVYKDFLTDLYSARATLHDRITLPDRAETINATQTLTINFNDRKETVKEEGIDKYQPKHYFHIVTTTKVLGSQLLVVAAYLQFLTIIGLIELYNEIQDDGKIGAAVIIMLLFRIIMYIFTKLLDIINKRIKLHIIIFAYYINTAFSAMFCRAVLFHAKEEKYISVIIGCKLFYRVFLYGIFGLRIDYWKTDTLKKLKAKLSRSKKNVVNKSEILSRKFGNASMRTDTLSMKQFEEIEKAKEEEIESSNKIMRIFVIRFIFGCVNDMFYCFASLGFVLGYGKLRDDSLAPIFAKERTDIYVKGTWIEIVVDICLMFLIGLVWLISKRYKFLRLSKSLTRFFRKYAAIFIYMNFALLVGFTFLIHSLELNSWGLP